MNWTYRHQIAVICPKGHIVMLLFIFLVLCRRIEIETYDFVGQFAQMASDNSFAIDKHF